MLSEQMESDLKEIECRLIKAQRPAFDRIKTALAELGTTPNKQSKQCQCGCDISEHICPSSLRTFKEVCA